MQGIIGKDTIMGRLKTMFKEAMKGIMGSKTIMGQPKKEIKKKTKKEKTDGTT